MKVKILRYCQEMIDGLPTVLDVNKIVDIQDGDACRLIERNLAQEIEVENKTQDIECENKMVNILYKKRGRPRKEV
jgi:hypothetical protein